MVLQDSPRLESCEPLRRNQVPDFSDVYFQTLPQRTHRFLTAFPNAKRRVHSNALASIARLTFALQLCVEEQRASQGVRFLFCGFSRRSAKQLMRAGDPFHADEKRDACRKRHAQSGRHVCSCIDACNAAERYRRKQTNDPDEQISFHENASRSPDGIDAEALCGTLCCNLAEPRLQLNVKGQKYLVMNLSAFTASPAYHRPNAGDPPTIAGRSFEHQRSDHLASIARDCGWLKSLCGRF
jgi:hypothetical protein